METPSSVSPLRLQSSPSNLILPLRDAFLFMIERVKGMKVLLVDSETLKIISLVYTQTQLLEQEVFLVEKIDAPGSSTSQNGTLNATSPSTSMRYLKAICFLRPTSETFLALAREIKQPRFNQYYLFFSNAIPHQQLQRLARCDEFEMVKQVHELYADILVPQQTLFHLGVPSIMSLMVVEPQLWTAYDESIFNRIIDGLFSTFCLGVQRGCPLIRYEGTSFICRKLADALMQRIQSENSLLDRADSNKIHYQDGNKNVSNGAINQNGRGCVFLLVDRREDPVTPLLNQWTYQAMIHELLGLENNRVNMKKSVTKDETESEIVMSPIQDSFFQENLLSNFGDLGSVTHQYVEEYQQKTKNTAQIQSIEDMQRFVDEYPEFRKLSGNVSKHVGVLHELSRIVREQDILDISTIEQELACHENRSEHFKAVSEKLRLQMSTKMERLRLVLLYALRYEGDSSIATLKDSLLLGKIEEEQARLVDTIIQFAGSKVRSGDLFNNRNFFALAKNTIKRGMKGTNSVFTQHKSRLFSVIELLLKNKLKEIQFPVMPTSYTTSPLSSKDRPAQVIVFVVGGITFEEARDMDEISTQFGCPIFLGGNYIHNSRSFLAEVTQFDLMNHSTSTSISGTKLNKTMV